MLDPLIVVVIGFVTFILLDSISPFLSNIALFVYFLFAYANIQGNQTLATFYLFALIFVLIDTGVKLSNSENYKIFGRGIRGVAVNLLGVVIGIGIFLFMRALQANTPSQIVGVPSLAIASVGFAPLTSGLLGIVENRAFFTILELLRKFGSTVWAMIPGVGAVLLLLGVIAPVVITAVLFTIFHSAAFSLALNAFIFAFLVFTIWITTYLIFRDDSAPNTAHFFWNSSIKLGQALTIA